MSNDFLKQYHVIVKPFDNSNYSLFFMNENVKKRIVEEFYIPVENAHFSKKKRNGQWNGKLKIVKSVFDKESGYWETIIPKGLWYELYIVCKKYNFNIKFEVKVVNDINFEKVKKYIDEKYNVQKYIKNDIRDFQYKCVYDLLKYNSICGEAVPASGKSLIIYLVCRLMLEKNYQTVIIVPNVGLCQQMYDDFKNYGFKNIAKNVQIINNEYKEKNFVKKIVISTWQSLQNKESFDNIDVIIADESDLSKNKQSKYFNIIKDCNNKKYSLALTGTVPNKKYAAYYDFLGNLGKHCCYTTEKMMENLKQITKVKILTKILNYSKVDKKIFHSEINKETDIGDFVKVRDKKYFDDEKIEYNSFKEILNRSMKISDIKNNTFVLENKYAIKKSYTIEEKGYLKELRLVTKHIKRLEYLKNLAETCDGNVLILFSKKSKEGYILKDYFEKNLSDKELIYIDGDTHKKNNLLDIVRNDKTNKKVLLAAIQVLGRGITVKNLKYCLFVTSMKSSAQIRQAIGRISRLYENKEIAYFIDIVDNYTLRDDDKLFTNCSTDSYLARESEYLKRGYEVEKENISFNESGI